MVVGQVSLHNCNKLRAVFHLQTRVPLKTDLKICSTHCRVWKMSSTEQWRNFYFHCDIPCPTSRTTGQALMVEGAVPSSPGLLPPLGPLGRVSWCGSRSHGSGPQTCLQNEAGWEFNGEKAVARLRLSAPFSPSSLRASKWALCTCRVRITTNIMSRMQRRWGSQARSCHYCRTFRWKIFLGAIKSSAVSSSQGVPACILIIRKRGK